MPTAEALIATDRAGRYLVQLCRHLDSMTRLDHRPHGAHGTHGAHGEGRTGPEIRQVDWSGTTGTVRFADGLWSLEAGPDALALRVDADDEESLRRLRAAATTRIEQIGRRARLRVVWEPPRESGAAAQPGDGGAPPEALPQSARPDAAGPPHRRHGTAAALAAGGVLVVAVHLGLGGAAAWTGWAAGTVLAVVLLKLVLMGGHLALGRVALRRGGAAAALAAVLRRPGRREAAPRPADTHRAGDRDG
ncbi:DUF2218 domain-containing protein [Streptacidiphilus griseoplanus]|uniref:DUF2218 domain-containing protein n=1 Tax=Peterkaempfera griseoplana TaxID=66896 RepID=UPI0006E35297|nr:DUF2218 domain-containing protein [Peterkaempfera griseoplana]